jgi:hypothetical protein
MVSCKLKCEYIGLSIVIRINDKKCYKKLNINLIKGIKLYIFIFEINRNEHLLCKLVMSTHGYHSKTLEYLTLSSLIICLIFCK